MIITVNTNSMTCIIDGVPYSLQDKAYKEPRTLADAFEDYLGAREYEGIVANIQRWFYGSLVKAPWCATSVSYFAHQLCIDKQTGKFESVDAMKDYMVRQNMLDCTANYGGGNYMPKRGDLVFHSSKKQFADCTHVSVVSSVNNSTGELIYVGGNQSDMICKKTTNYKTDKSIIAFGRINY